MVHPIRDTVAQPSRKRFWECFPSRSGVPPIHRHFSHPDLLGEVGLDRADLLPLPQAWTNTRTQHRSVRAHVRAAGLWRDPDARFARSRAPWPPAAATSVATHLF